MAIEEYHICVHPFLESSSIAFQFSRVDEISTAALLLCPLYNITRLFVLQILHTTPFTTKRALSTKVFNIIAISSFHCDSTQELTGAHALEESLRLCERYNASFTAGAVHSLFYVVISRPFWNQTPNKCRIQHNIQLPSDKRQTTIHGHILKAFPHPIESHTNHLLCHSKSCNIRKHCNP